MDEKKRDKCTIGYKVGVTRGMIYGTRFFNTIECCTSFSIWFYETGNLKTPNFNFNNSEEKPGFNLVTRNNSLKLVLRLDKNSREHEIKSCPFCGAEVSLVEACRVKLISITKTMHEGYREEGISRNSEIPLPPVCL